MKEFPIWCTPQHQLRVEKPSPHVHWVTLFVGLAHVGTILLPDTLAWHGLLIFAALLIALFQAWVDGSAYKPLYLPADIPERSDRFLQARCRRAFQHGDRRLVTVRERAVLAQRLTAQDPIARIAGRGMTVMERPLRRQEYQLPAHPGRTDMLFWQATARLHLKSCKPQQIGDAE